MPPMPPVPWQSAHRWAWKISFPWDSSLVIGGCGAILATGLEAMDDAAEGALGEGAAAASGAEAGVPRFWR